MEFKTLIDGYKKILDHIYSPKYYYERVRTFLQEYKPPKIEIPLNLESLIALLRSCVRLGIFGRERFQYWKLLLWTLRRRPELMPLAVTFAIYGHHFRKICEIRIL